MSTVLCLLLWSSGWKRRTYWFAIFATRQTSLPCDDINLLILYQNLQQTYFTAYLLASFKSLLTLEILCKFVTCALCPCNAHRITKT